MSWDLQLDTAEFRHVTFECQRLTDNAARKIVEYSYPWRNGVDLDDLGKGPRRTTITAVFFGTDYESKLGALIDTVDEGLAGDFIHPILGKWKARLNITSIDHDHSARDIAYVSIDVIEDGTNAELDTLFSVESLETDVNTQADNVLTNNTLSYDDVIDAASQAKEFASDAADRINETADRVNEVRKKIEKAIQTIEELTDVENYVLFQSLMRMNHACHKLADRVNRTSPVIIKKDINTQMPLPLLAHRFYGDQDKAETIANMNPAIKNPFLPPHFVQLKLPSK